MNRLREVRLKKQLAIIGLSAQSGVSATTICGIEKWDYLPRLSTRLRIADALNVTINEIWPDALVPAQPMAMGTAPSISAFIQAAPTL